MFYCFLLEPMRRRPTRDNPLKRSGKGVKNRKQQQLVPEVVVVVDGMVDATFFPMCSFFSSTLFFVFCILFWSQPVAFLRSFIRFSIVPTFTTYGNTANVEKLLFHTRVIELPKSARVGWHDAMQLVFFFAEVAHAGPDS